MNSLTTLKLEAPASVVLPSIEDWLYGANDQSQNRDVEFSGGLLAEDRARRIVRCRVTCVHRGNVVSARAEAKTSGEAFIAALAQIERTIGETRRQIP